MNLNKTPACHCCQARLQKSDLSFPAEKNIFRHRSHDILACSEDHLACHKLTEQILKKEKGKLVVVDKLHGLTV